MKLNKFASLMIIGLALAVAAAGCKSTQNVRPITPLPPGGTSPDYSQGGPRPYGDDLPDDQPITAQPNREVTEGATRDESTFQSYTVHFAYDSHAIRSSERSKVAAVADYMKANPSNYLEIQGHCDERGTDQYNYSLGERRALALRDALIRQGVDGGHITTVSFGRSRKIDEGHTDEAHAKNRRGEFILLVK